MEINTAVTHGDNLPGHSGRKLLLKKKKYLYISTRLVNLIV